MNETVNNGLFIGNVGCKMFCSVKHHSSAGENESIDETTLLFKTGVWNHVSKIAM